MEALIRASILSDDEDAATSDSSVAGAGLTDPAVVTQWQEEREAEAAEASGDAMAVSGREPRLQMTDLTDPRPGAAALETPLDDPEEEITLKEVFPEAFAATLNDAGQWSRIVRCDHGLSSGLESTRIAQARAQAAQARGAGPVQCGVGTVWGGGPATGATGEAGGAQA